MNATGGVSVFLVPPLTSGPDVMGASYDHLMDDFLLVERAAHSHHGPHRRVDDPHEADVILFVGSRDRYHRDVRRHPLTRRFPRKAILYSSEDGIFPFLRGIYPGLPQDRAHPRRTRSGHYLRWSYQPDIQFTDPWLTPTHLFGFSGDSANHPLRHRLLQLRHPRALLRDTHHDPARRYGQPDEVYVRFRKRYAQELSAVRFVLCPRGLAPNSMRLFEAMKAGRVPVVLSDQWVPAPGPSWETFMLRVPEADVAHLPMLLEREEHRAAAMGMAARSAWEQWFAPEVSFQVLAASAADLVAVPWRSEGLERVLLRRHLFAEFCRRILRRLHLHP